MCEQEHILFGNCADRGVMIGEWQFLSDKKSESEKNILKKVECQIKWNCTYNSYDIQKLKNDELRVDD